MRPQVRLSTSSAHTIVLSGRIIYRVRTPVIPEEVTKMRGDSFLHSLVGVCRALHEHCVAFLSSHGHEDAETVWARTIFADCHVYQWQDTADVMDESKEQSLELWSLFQQHCLSNTGEVAAQSSPKTAFQKGVEGNRLMLSDSGKRAWDYAFCLRWLLQNCEIALLDGTIGLVPRGTLADDQVVIFDGALTPFIIRPVEGTTDYLLIGQCFVLGMMYGELCGVKEDADPRFEARDIPNPEQDSNLEDEEALDRITDLDDDCEDEVGSEGVSELEWQWADGGESGWISLV